MGGRDIPASGFALYLDRLMNLIKPATLAKPAAQRILIKADPRGNVLKEAFSLADYLHQAGYAAEVYLGGGEPADLRWTLDVQNKAPLFVLTDRVNNTKSEAQTSAEVLTLLEGNRSSNM